MPKPETGEGFYQYLNQEQYLKIFSKGGKVPLDKITVDLSIHGFRLEEQTGM